MKCYHCNGVMSYETFYSLQGIFSGWRCIFCGEILDRVVLENRRQSIYRRQKKMWTLSETTQEESANPFMRFEKNEEGDASLLMMGIY
jgi:hypothetical protein